MVEGEETQSGAKMDPWKELSVHLQPKVLFHSQYTLEGRGRQLGFWTQQEHQAQLARIRIWNRSYNFKQTEPTL